MLKHLTRNKRRRLTIRGTLSALVVATAVRQTIVGNYENLFLCVLTLVLFCVPMFIDRRLGIDLPPALETIIYCFIFSAEILGEVNSYYTRIPSWDTMLHTINGFLMAAIGFALVDIFNRSEKFTFKLSPLFLAVVAFCFSMTVGVLWEFFEFFMDTRFATDMQKDWIVHTIHSVMFQPDGLNIVVHKPIESLVVNGEDWIAKYGGYIDIGLIDTMKDLIVNFIGAVTFSVIGFFYAKKRGQGRFASAFIPRVRETFSRHKDKS
ncbi:MAG: hypothetical protein SPJ01_03560 [Butyricicoccus sp.]|nr:hypothetical protein [Clostridiales bacterium]MDY5971938.1 hypothetical protein [Butyricicoccus sp.]